jgi:hypothetical protein
MQILFGKKLLVGARKCFDAIAAHKRCVSQQQAHQTPKTNGSRL